MLYWDESEQRIKRIEMPDQSDSDRLDAANQDAQDSFILGVDRAYENALVEIADAVDEEIPRDNLIRKAVEDSLVYRHLRSWGGRRGVEDNGMSIHIPEQMEPYATLCMTQDGDYVGFSLVSKKDQFSRRIGRRIATSRLMTWDAFMRKLNQKVTDPVLRQLIRVEAGRMYDSVMHRRRK